MKTHCLMAPGMRLFYFGLDQLNVNNSQIDFMYDALPLLDKRDHADLSGLSAVCCKLLKLGRSWFFNLNLL